MGKTKNEVVIQDILSLYDLQVKDVRSLQSFYLTNAAFMADTVHGRFVVKPYRGSETDLKRLCLRLRLLRQAGFRQMPKWVSTNQRKTYVRRRGQLFYVTEFVDGSHLGPSSTELRGLGEALATFHLASGKLHRSRASDQMLEPIIRQHQRFVRTWASVKNETQVGRWLQRYGPVCQQLGEEAHSIFKAAPTSRVLKREAESGFLIHGDVTRPNVLVSDDEIQIIDWESLRPGVTFVDLAKAMANTTDFDRPLIRALLRGYEQVRPMNLAERRVVSALFRIPREAWTVARDPLSKRSSVVLQALEGTWKARLRAIAMVDEWAKGEE